MSTILSKEDLLEGLSGMMLIEDRKRVFASHEAQRDKIEELEDVIVDMRHAVGLDNIKILDLNVALENKIEELERKLTKAEGLNKVDKMQISIMHDNDDKSYAKIEELEKEISVGLVNIKMLGLNIRLKKNVEELEIKVNTWKTKYFDKDRDGIALERALDDACEMLTELLKDLLKLGVERGALTGSPEEYVATHESADKLKQHFIEEAKKEN